MKTSKTSKILALLAKGMTVKKVAEKVGTSANYVYAVRWQAANKSKKTPAKKAKKTGIKVSNKAEDTTLPWDAIEPADLTQSEIVNTVTAAREEVANGFDDVNHPYHYTAGGIETIDYIEAKCLSYNLGNVVKYVSRAYLKNPAVDGDIKDLEKAQWYLKREIETLRKSL